MIVTVVLYGNMPNLLRESDHLQPSPQNRLGITSDVNMSMWSKWERQTTLWSSGFKGFMQNMISLPAFPLTGSIELLNMV